MISINKNSKTTHRIKPQVVKCGGKMKVIAQELFKCEKCGSVVSTCGWLWKCNEDVIVENKL